jgi:Tol biopolymer transport system component
MTPNGFRARSAVAAMAVVVALVTSACTISVGGNDPSISDATSAPAATPSASPVGSPDPRRAGSSASGRLAIVERDGSLSTSLPDGTDRTILFPGGGNLTAAQPTWSPNGRRIAWVVQNTAAGPAGGAIAVSGAHGEDPEVTTTPFVPYYLGWDPTGHTVAFLGSGGDPDVPVELGVLTVGRDAHQPRTIAGGSPFFYFAWGPDGDRIVAHAGVNRLEEIDLDGHPSRAIAKPGMFAAPAWSADGRTLAYVIRGPGGVQRLMVRTDGAPPRSVAQGLGVFSFLLRPDGQALAYQLLGRDEGPSLARAPATPSGGIWVADLVSGHSERATDVPAMTFSWSPDGARLLALSPVPAADRPTPFMWQVWNGRSVATVAGVHAPTLEYFRDYAPFFTQYAQNTTPWSPSGNAFAYAAEGPDGLGRIVVQRVSGDAVVVGTGVFVTWSP